jgi:Holliday junction resolvase RusA-like endonuclease
MIELTIPEAYAPLNRMLGETWSKRIQTRRRWAWLVRQAKLAARVFPEAPIARARVTIVRHGRRICDPDNLIGGAKGTIDCLVREGILANDTPAHVELIITQQVTKSPKTVVTIEALGAEIP